MSTVKSQPRERKTESIERRKKQGKRMRGNINTGCLWLVIDFPVALKFSIMNANFIWKFCILFVSFWKWSPQKSSLLQHHLLASYPDRDFRWWLSVSQLWLSGTCRVTYQVSPCFLYPCSRGLPAICSLDLLPVSPSALRLGPEAHPPTSSMQPSSWPLSGWDSLSPIWFSAPL